MKKLLAFAMVVSLGLFCAIGCQPTSSTTPPKDKQEATPVTNEAKPDAKATGDAAKAVPAEEKKQENK